MNRNQMIKELIKTFPGINGIKKSEDMGFSPGGIFLGDAGEGGTIDGISAFDYYAEDPTEEVYIMHVHRKLYDCLNDNEWFAEAHNPGILMAWR